MLIAELITVILWAAERQGLTLIGTPVKVGLQWIGSAKDIGL